MAVFLVVVLVLEDLVLVAFSALAYFARAALRREAVFFFIRSFLTALSYSDWALERFSGVGLALKTFRAALMVFLIS